MLIEVIAASEYGTYSSIHVCYKQKDKYLPRKFNVNVFCGSDHDKKKIYILLLLPHYGLRPNIEYSLTKNISSFKTYLQRDMQQHAFQH